MTNTCSTDWVYEVIPGRGWLYNQPTLTYNDPVFDTLEVTYNSLGEATVWDLPEEKVDFVSTWNYEKADGMGWLYNEPTLEYNAEIFDTFTVYYNSLGQPTEWFYEEFIDYCSLVQYQFMDGDDFLFQDGTNYYFN